MRHFWLNFHVGYACRHHGACCSSGWPIPVERDRVIPIQSLAAGPTSDWLIAEANAPDDVAGSLALGSSGHCVFHGDGCRIHAARPASCAHFPYRCLIDPRGVHVTLSHYCPTAASMLFAHDEPIEIVEGPAPVAGRDVPEGLDAREALPPLAAPNFLMTFEALTAWERAAVAAPWPEGVTPARNLELFEQARRAVPSPLEWLAAPAELERIWEERVQPSCREFAPVLARYRAAKVFASWPLYLGDGLAAIRSSVDQAGVVLQVEAARQCAAKDAPLDATRLKEAIRQTDLLLMHYADPHLLL